MDSISQGQTKEKSSQLKSYTGQGEQQVSTSHKTDQPPVQSFTRVVYGRVAILVPRIDSVG